MDTEEKYINALFDGVTLDCKSISDIKFEKRQDGIIGVQLRDEYSTLATLHLPSGWHQHEFEIGGNDNCTIRCCKKCGKTSMLLPSRHQWKNIAEGE